MSHSTYLANEMLDHTFRGVGAAYTAPAEWHVQLHYGAPGDDGTANAWAAAGRAPCTDWTSSTAGNLQNAVDILWEDVPDPGVNNTFPYVTIWDAAVAGNCLQVCAISPVPLVAEEDNVLIEAGSSLSLSWPNSNFRYVIEDFNDWDAVHSPAWLSAQPAGTVATTYYPTGNLLTVFSLAPGEGTNGSQALKLTVPERVPGDTDPTHKWGPSWWMAPFISTGGSYANCSGDNSYLIPRGMRVNYMEMRLKFPADFAPPQVSSPPDTMFHMGTYCSNPTTGGVETNGFHFYHFNHLRTNAAAGDWITMRWGCSPDHMRGATFSGYGVGQNPTAPHGEYFSLLGRSYFSSYPETAESIPGCAFPYDVLIDEIAMGWEEPREDVSGIVIQIEDWVKGQKVHLAWPSSNTFTASITNTSSLTVTGATKLFAYYTYVPSLTYQGGGAVPATEVFSPGETKNYELHFAPYADSNRPAWFGFYPSDMLVNPAVTDPNHWKGDGGSKSGRPDAWLPSFTFAPEAWNPIKPLVATCEGGLFLTCAANGTVSRTIKARHQDNSFSQITIVTQPTGGNVTVDSNNLVTFTATPAYTGTCFFEYTCAGDGGSAKRRSWVTVS